MNCTKDYVQEVTKKAIRKNRICKVMKDYMEEAGTVKEGNPM